MTARLQERLAMNLSAVALRCAHAPFLHGVPWTSWDRIQKILVVRRVASGFNVLELGNWSGFEALGDKTPCFAAGVHRFWPRF